MRAISILLLFTFCNPNHQRGKTIVLAFDEFTINTPITWKKIDLRPFEGPMGKIVIDKDDTLVFAIGTHEPNLSENIAVIERSSLKYIDMSLLDTNDINIVDDIRHFDPDRFRKNNIAWDTIDGHLAKIVFPIKPGLGTTGIFIDSFYEVTVPKEIHKFILTGNNLKPQNQQQVLQAIKTISFRKRK